MNSPWHTLLDPTSRKSLHFTAVGGSFGYLTDEDDSQHWPVALGIAFLRADRRELADAVVSLISSAEYAEALGQLLHDTDDFAPQSPALKDCIQLAERLLTNDSDLHAREMMELLCYGPVADYFALRGSAPSFFSGLGLLKIGATSERPVIEVGCGAGHFLYWLRTRGVDVMGTDTVFSKLCLAHRFMGIRADRLICAAAGKAHLPIGTTSPTQVFCHDAFYFIEDKANCLEDFRRLTGQDGTLLIGHAHLSTADHGKVSGFPVALDAYRKLAAVHAHFYEDAALVTVGAGTGPLISEISRNAEAISFIEGNLRTEQFPWWESEGELLHAPLEVTWSPADSSTRMNWPSAAFAAEYASADYLQSSGNPFEHLPASDSRDSKLIHPGLAIPGPFLGIGAKPLRWGIIGGGWIATDYFVPAFPYLPHVRLVALAESNDERRAAFAQTPGLRTFSDWRDMLATCQLDAIYIATPNDSHAKMIEGVAAFGLRVLCEKPVTTNLHDLERIRRCSRQNPDFFQTAYDQRYHPAHIQLAKGISKGVLGTITQVRVHYACWVDDDWNKVSATDNWRIDRKRAGGGAGFDLLPHCLDLVSMLVGESISDAHLFYQGRVHDYARNNQVDDGALMSARTAKGILVSFHVGYNCPEDQPRRRVEVIGTRGRVEALNTMGQDPGGELVWQTASGKTRETFSPSTEAGPFVRQLDSLSRLWLREDKPKFSFERDLDLAERLIHCDTQARSRSVVADIPS
jgi:1,5-anhydro-D-fructose reductase (1,5-anhydro-D-mannitol-forming)